MASVTKFTFDLDFDQPEETANAEPDVIEEEEEPEEEIPTFSEEELEQARADGFAKGKEQGRKEAAEATEQRLLEAIEKTCQDLATVYNAQADANREIARETIAIATGIARKMFPDLNARNALGEVERVVQQTLNAINDEPRVQIMVHPDLREPFSERLTTMTHRAGFEGKVFVNPDPSMALGDCRVEWSNGAAVRNAEQLWEMIDEIIERNLHGPDGAPPEAEAAPEAGMRDAAPSPETTEAPAAPAPETAEDAAPQPPADDTAGESVDAESPTPAAAETAPEDVPAHDSGEETTGIPAADDRDASNFAPNVDVGDLDIPENTLSDQEHGENPGTPPTPHIDDAGETGGGAGEADEAAAPVKLGEPVSPEMATAILDAQAGDTDGDPGDDGEEPSGQ